MSLANTVNTIMLASFFHALTSCVAILYFLKLLLYWFLEHLPNGLQLQNIVLVNTFTDIVNILFCKK